MTATAEFPQATRTAIIVAPNEGQRVQAFDNEILFKLGAEQTDGQFTLGFASIRAGGKEPPVHMHSREDELFIVLEGEYSFFADETWTDAPVGSVVYLPRGVPHTFRVTGEKNGRHIVFTTPGGFEKFFAEYAEVFSIPGPPNFHRIRAISEKYGMYF